MQERDPRAVVEHCEQQKLADRNRLKGLRAAEKEAKTQIQLEMEAANRKIIRNGEWFYSLEDTNIPIKVSKTVVAAHYKAFRRQKRGEEVDDREAAEFAETFDRFRTAAGDHKRKLKVGREKSLDSIVL